MILEKYCRVLELDKILAQLAEYTCCETARERALAIRPSTNLLLVEDEVRKANDAYQLTVRLRLGRWTIQPSI